MLEAIATSLVASGIASGGGIAAGKAREILRRERFSDEIDGLTTEFTSALKESLKTAISDANRDDIADLEANWTTIAEELDDIDDPFSDEREAVVEITDAIAAGLDIDLTEHPQVRESLEAAVAEAAQQTIRGFAERIAGTDLADVFMTEMSIEVVEHLDDVDDSLTAIQRRLRRHEIVALRNAGFVRLDPLYFQRQNPGDPESAWRTRFDLVEVRAGYPLPRERPTTGNDDERTAVKSEIHERLDAGEDLVVLGEGGSGKSTVCKRVACEWHEAGRGPVFYRGSKATAAFDEPGELIEAIRASEGDVLVVVEDAASKDAKAVYEVLDEFEGTSDVSFLLDSRTSVWRDADGPTGEASLERQHQKLGIVQMPALDETECQRAIEHYEDLTGEDVPHEGERLYEEVRSADIGGPLLLAYRLTGPPVDTDDKQTVSALHADVRGAYEEVAEWANGEDFPQTVAVMVNVLNAAGLPVEEAFVHALAASRDDHRTIDKTLGFLEGTILEQGPEGVRTPHEVWSALYLERLIVDVGERLARDRFEECVYALFRLVDEEARRKQVRGWLREEPDVIATIAAKPKEEAGQFVRQIARIGRSRATLGVLLGSPQTWTVKLPDPCPSIAEVDWFNSRGATHFRGGALEKAEAEFEQLEAVIESTLGNEDGAVWWRARALGNLGTVAQARGNLATAEEYHRESLAINREIGNRHSAASNLNNLGVLAGERGDLDSAEEHLQDSLAINREVGNRHGAAQSLTNLGVVNRKRGDQAAAEEHLQDSLAINREVGNRHSAAKSLEALALVAKGRGDLADAEEYHRESLTINRDVGNRHGAAKSLGNLGAVTQQRGDLDDAEQYIEEAAEILLDIGAARDALTVLHNLVDVTEQQEEVDTAIEWCEQGIDVADELDDDDWLDDFRERRAALREEN